LTVLETLGQAELFSGLSDADCRALEKLGHRRGLAAGQSPFRLGDARRRSSSSSGAAGWS